MTFLRVSLAAIFLVASQTFVLVAAQDTARKIPIEAFAALPSFGKAKLSPDGQQIAYQGYLEGRTILIAENIGGTDRVVIPPLGNADIFGFHWASNDRILVIYEFTARRHGAHVRSQQTRLAAVNRDGTNFKLIVEPEKIPFKGSRISTEELPSAQFQHEIVDMLHDDPDHILLSIDADRNGKNEIRKINIHTGEFKRVREDEAGIQTWRKDPNGNIRYGAGYRKSEWITLIQNAEGKWISPEKSAWGNQYTFEDFSSDPNIIFVYGTSSHGNRGIFKIALDSGEVIETVFEHPEVDADYTVVHPYSGEPIGVAYTDNQPRIKYFHKTWKKVQAVVDKSLPDTVNRIVSKARAEHIYLIASSSPNDPGVYYYLDIQGKRLELVGSVMSHIDPNEAAHTQEVSIPVRDGSQIPAFLTLPKGTAASPKLPTVIMPHGGPASRSDATWNYRVQFLANRGYAVLQPNFRGSTGYGSSFQLKGEHQWGGLMQDDVTDATRWLIKNKIADKKRICIVGASYGGYSALMGTVKEPKLYKCAASINGVTNIPRLKGDDKHFIGGRAWIKTMGLEDSRDSDVSPFHQAEAIKAPILLIAAKDDARIDYQMSKSMHSRLEKLGTQSTYVELENGGHSLDTGISRLESLQALESFLQEQIGN